MISTNGLFLFSDRIESKYTCILGGWLFDYTLGHQPVDYSYSPTAWRVSIPVYKMAGCLIAIYDINQWIIPILRPHGE